MIAMYIVNSAAGIRTHPYSTSATVNPLKYGNIATLNEVHSAYHISEIWANLLHNIYAALVAQYNVFASKGLGVNAAGHVNDADIPPDC
ncbi:hypothetical protein B0H13DRAFT_2346446 [Mycena leptocephala]|nr:hypothetical protein B0H13DRAFT_2346446 [Mycena leptocephala]